MKIKLIRIIKVICFCMVTVLMVNYLTELFTPKWLENRWQSAKTNNSFYELEKNTVDVAIMGSSVIAAAVDPYQLYEEYGISSYNLGVMQQPMLGTFCWLEEVIRTQNPKVVAVEIKTAGRVSDKDEVDARKSFDYLKWGKSKLRYAVEYANTNKETDIFEYLFPLSKYHTRWSDISYDDYDFLKGNNYSTTRGFATLTTRSNVEWDGIKMNPEKIVDKYNKTNERYLKRIIELCQKNNIDIVLLKTPDTSWSTSRYNHIKEIADEYKIDYIDFNTEEMIDKTGLVYTQDGADTVHLNLDGAKKITKYLGEYLSSNYKLTDYRTTDSKIQKIYESEMDAYKKTYEDAKLCMEYNLDNYLNKINQEKYSIIVGTGRDFNGTFSNEQIKLLKAWGIPDDMFKEDDIETNIVGIFDKKNNVFKKSEITEECPQIKEEGTLNDGAVYSVTSVKSGCKIVINTHDYTVKNSELNMVVYNNETGKVADSVYLWIDTDGTIKISR